MREPKIAIIDLGMGNLFSIKQACTYVGLDAVVTHDHQELDQAQGLILPGVGAFGDAMKHLKEYDLIGFIKNFIQEGKPFLGVCLGMQLLMSESEEFGMNRGLDVIPGRVLRFSNKGQQNNNIKVPQVGWNQVFLTETGRDHPSDLWSGIEDGEYMYFVHSFYVSPDQPEVVALKTNYEGLDYCSGIIQKNIFATQFHPEKSAEKGLQIYQNWANYVRRFVSQ